MRLSFAAISFALISIVPLASATFVPTGPKNCKTNEFWWPTKSCCLPSGGPPVRPPPPAGVQCPPTGFYWGEKQKCCVPRNNPPSKPPTPQCPKNWTWYPLLHKCLPTPQPPQPPKPQPSKGYHHGGKKRSVSTELTPCPVGLNACPIPGLSSGDYECIDTANELESCGGCASEGKGQDCTLIEGAWNVGCDQGSCAVYTCAGGFQVSLDGKTCNRL